MLHFPSGCDVMFVLSIRKQYLIGEFCPFTQSLMVTCSWCLDGSLDPMVKEKYFRRFQAENTTLFSNVSVPPVVLIVIFAERLSQQFMVFSFSAILHRYITTSIIIIQLITTIQTHVPGRIRNME